MNIAEIEVSYKSKVKASERIQIKTSRHAFEILQEMQNPDTIELHESFYLIVLNRANHVLGWIKISQGGVAATVVDPKIIFSIALKANASGIILAHNHPSGNLKPSTEDIQLTKKIKECARILDINLLDHLIITNENYYSFADEGQI